MVNAGICVARALIPALQCDAMAGGSWSVAAAVAQDTMPGANGPVSAVMRAGGTDARPTLNPNPLDVPAGP